LVLSSYKIGKIKNLQFVAKRKKNRLGQSIYKFAFHKAGFFNFVEANKKEPMDSKQNDLKPFVEKSPLLVEERSTSSKSRAEKEPQRVRRVHIWIVFTLCVAYCFYQIDDYLISVTVKNIQKSQHWGNGDGTGVQYDTLVGPMFTLVHLACGLPVGYFVDRKLIHRSLLLGCAVLIWSLCAVLTGYSTEYWQIAVLRVILVCFVDIY
ncbi:hypothetical protein RFI_29489, partial [Reticulomyxa filosa]